MNGSKRQALELAADYTAWNSTDVDCPLEIGIVADTHGVLDARIVDVLRDCDAVVHAGDIGSDAVVVQLDGLDVPAWAVAGNNDTPAKWRGDRSQHHLPESVVVALPGGKLIVEHGDKVLPAARRHELLRVKHGDARAIVYGHSHHLVIDQTSKPWVLNPGAAGRARTFGGPSCLVLRIDEDMSNVGEWQWIVQPHKFPLEKRATSASN